MLDPADNRVGGAGGSEQVNLHLSAAAPIAGVEGVLIVPLLAAHDRAEHADDVRPALRRGALDLLAAVG